MSSSIIQGFTGILGTSTSVPQGSERRSSATPAGHTDELLNDGPQSECGDSHCQGCLACSAAAAAAKPMTVQARVARLIAFCAASRNPACAFSKASSRVGALARRYENASRFYYLASALNELKHAECNERWGRNEEARGHRTTAGVDVWLFVQAASRL